MNNKNTPPNAGTGGAMPGPTPTQSVTILGTESDALTDLVHRKLVASDPAKRLEYRNAYKLLSELTSGVLASDSGGTEFAWTFDQQGLKGFIYYRKDDTPEPVVSPLLLEGPTAMFGSELVSDLAELFASGEVRKK